MIINNLLEIIVPETEIEFQNANGEIIMEWEQGYDIDIPLAKLYPLFPEQPIFGQKRPKNKNGKYSHWLVFMKF